MLYEDTSVNNVYGSTGASAVVISIVGGGVCLPVEDASSSAVRHFVGDAVETPWSTRAGGEGIRMHLGVLLNPCDLVGVNNLGRI